MHLQPAEDAIIRLLSPVLSRLPENTMNATVLVVCYKAFKESKMESKMLDSERNVLKKERFRLLS